MSLEPEQIGAIVQQVAEINKQRNDAFKKKSLDKLPEYYDGYQKKVDQYDAIRVHSEKDYFPEKLMRQAAPNQTDEERAYIRGIYRQDLTVWGDYVNTTTRFFDKSNWNITYEETPGPVGDDTFQAYVESRFIPGTTPKNLMSWMIEVVPSIKGKDAEGVIAVRPKEILFDENGEIRTDQLIDPIPVYYNVTQIMNQNTEDWVLVETERKSIVEFGGKPKREGLVYEFYDEENIWIIEQVGKKIDLTFNVIPFFHHGWGQVPVTKLMGLPFIFQNKELNHSPFLFAVDPLNEVLIDRNNLRLAKANSVYPIKIMLGNECQFTENVNGESVTCNSGFLRVYDRDSQQTTSKPCPNCQGTGLANRTSPQGTILVNPKADFDGKEVKAADTVRFVEPEGNTLIFLKGEIQDNTQEARRILFLPTNNISTEGEKMTATENIRDEKAMQAFLRGVSNQTFDIYDFLVASISWFRYASEPLATILKPRTFDITTEADFVHQIGLMHEKGMDPAIISMKTDQYMRSIYATSEERTNRVRLWLLSDRLVGMSFEEMSIKLANQTIAKWEEYLHCSPFTIMNEIPGIFDMPIEKQIEQMHLKAQEETSKIQVTSRQGRIDEVIGGSNENT